MYKTKIPTSDKDSYREETKRRISLMNTGERLLESQRICEQLQLLPSIQEATTIILYQALKDEVSLLSFIDWTIREGKNIITIDTTGTVASLPKCGVILVPGRAFTLSGQRIGRGSGWYDRLLCEYPEYYSIGICFHCQIFSNIPQDIWDIPMHSMLKNELLLPQKELS